MNLQRNVQSARRRAAALLCLMLVVPVVAMPGWFVERTGRGSVRVFSGRELAGLLKARGAQPLSPEDVRRVAHQLEQRCRTVAPQFAPVEQGPSAV